jgi:hypothetical protein
MNMTSTLAILQKHGIRDGVKMPMHNGISSTFFVRKGSGNAYVRWKASGRIQEPVYIILASCVGWKTTADAAAIAAEVGVNVRYDTIEHDLAETPLSSVIITPSGAEHAVDAGADEGITSYR